MKMTPDELEYSISQYLDGTLLPLERAALEDRLASDGDARALLEEYRRLDTALKHKLPAMPSIAWDRFAGQIQQAVATAEEPRGGRSFFIGSVSWAGRLAIAAALLFAVSIGVFFVNRPTPVRGTAIVTGPTAEPSTGTAVAEISIGPSQAVAHNWRAGEEVVTRPTVVLIDSAHQPGQDSDVLY
jgi:anti-sigma factor RsiW